MCLALVSLGLLLQGGPNLAVHQDLEKAFQSLQQAIQTKQDAAVVKKLAVDTHALTEQVLLEAAPESETAAAGSELEFLAREVGQYAEYALFAAALQAPPAVTADLISTLEQQNPKSRYLDEAYGPYFVALNQTGAAAKIPGIAEKALPNFPENEDLLLVLADTALTRQQGDRALGYSQRLLAALGKHPKPERVPAADWDRKRNLALGRGHWIAGLVYADKHRFYQADQELRAALPLIQGNQAMLGPALFQLGVANYQLGRTMLNKRRVLEAAQFSEQAAGIPGPLAQQAWRNAMVMKTEAQGMR